MRRYLATLHTKPDHHKRRFAFLTSGIVTLIIFGFWSAATFGIDRTTVTKSGSENEAGPLESLSASLASSFAAFRGTFFQLKDGLETINMERKYEELRDGALDTYGR